MRRATLHLAQSEQTPCAERVNTLRRATLHLAQSESTPCTEQPCALRRATQHLAQSKSTPCAEQPCASRSATRHLALRNPMPRSEQLNTSRRVNHHLAQREGVLALHPRAERANSLRSARWKWTRKKGSRFFFSTEAECSGIVLALPIIVCIPLSAFPF